MFYFTFFSYTVIIVLSISQTLCENNSHNVVLEKNKHVKFLSEFLRKIINNKHKSEGSITAITNDYADKVFTNIQDLLIRTGFDPSQLSNITEGFSYTLLFITYHGEFILNHGWLKDLSTLHRNGDVVITYSTSTKKYEITIPMAFDDLIFYYDYSAKIMDLGPKGAINGKITDLKVIVKLGFDFENFVASLNEFQIVNAGTISFTFSGNILIDWLLDILTNLFTTIMKRIILSIVETIIHIPLQSLVSDINQGIDGILHPSTPAPLPAIYEIMNSHNVLS